MGLANPQAIVFVCLITTSSTISRPNDNFDFSGILEIINQD